SRSMQHGMFTDGVLQASWSVDDVLLAQDIQRDMPEMPGTPRVSRQHTTIAQNGAPDSRAQRQHDHITATLSGAQPCLAFESCLAIIQDGDRCLVIEACGPTHPLNEAEPAFHQGDGVIMGAPQAW